MAEGSVMVATDTSYITGKGNGADLNGYTAAKVTAGIGMHRTFNSPEVDILSSRNGGRRREVPTINYKRLGKVAAAAAFAVAAVYFAGEQVFTASSLDGTVTSPLITIHSPIDGV